MAPRNKSGGACGKAEPLRGAYLSGMNCRACGEKGSVTTRSLFWRVLAAAFWVPMLAVGVCCALAIPLNLLLVPCWMACASAVGPLARKASEARCRHCGASATSLPEIAGAHPRPSHEGAMERALV